MPHTRILQKNLFLHKITGDRLESCGGLPSDGEQKLTDAIVLYTHPDCTYSDALKSELDNLELDYEEINLALHPDKWTQVEELANGERITPVMVTGNNVEVGFHGVG